MTMGQDESNWFLQIAEDHVPAAAAQLSDRQRDFLDALASRLSSTTWEVSNAERLDIEKALELQDMFHRGARASLGCRWARPCGPSTPRSWTRHFTMQIGLLLVRLEQPFAISRLRDVSRKRPLAA